MTDRDLRCSRRKFLASAAAAVTLASGSRSTASAESAPATHFRAQPPRPSVDGRKPIACITTVYRPMSHSFHIAGRFLHGYPRDGAFHVPQHFVRGIAVDQTPENDLSRDLAREFGARWSRNVADVLLDGDKLAVDGVLLIAEHGNYPRNDKGQILYPRWELFQQIVEAFRKAGRSVPVFCDKHLSYSWAKAKQMYDTARELKFPLMAGSSLPVTWRRPELELPLQAPLDEALVAAYGPIEVYGFHALETLQCMVERRKSGESGVKSVTCLTGRDVWKAGDDGRWSWDLLEAALGRSETVCPGDVRRNVGNYAVQGMPQTPATAFLVEYRDGFRGTVLLLNGHLQDFVFAGKVRGEAKPASCLFHLPPPPGAKYFDALVANIEKMFESGRPPYPVERTLLTSGMLDALLTSHQRRGERTDTPELEVRYAAPADSGFLRGDVSAPV
ncbi:MAG: hypothetical protein ACJ8F7_05105 [Gemmataceae bacterium]